MGSKKSPTQPIDSNQLLSLCKRIRDSLSNLDKSISLVQLRLTTLSYIQDDIEDSSLKCFDSLIELSNLSQLIVHLLEELHQKLSDSSENSIQYQLASQQLMFFTTEWYENFAPRLNEIFELAGSGELSKLTNRFVGTTTPNNTRQQRLLTMNTSLIDSDSDSNLVRIRDALLRLKQSMMENERLIAIIATNIEYTRTTIETIYDSLQSTKFGLEVGEQNAIEAVALVREANRLKIICYLLLASVLVALTVYLIHITTTLF